MKNQKGITLVSLVIYIIVMMIVIVTLSMILNQFYENNNNLEEDTEEIIEFNKFNTYFLKEVKIKGNKVDNIEDNYILFSSGNYFSFANNKIYYNDIMICEKVKNFEIQKGKNGDNTDDTVIFVTLNFEKFSKSMNYKIEEIY